MNILPPFPKIFSLSLIAPLVAGSPAADLDDDGTETRSWNLQPSSSKQFTRLKIAQ